jgi:hypothetical protein
LYLPPNPSDLVFEYPMTLPPGVEHSSEATSR